MSDHPTPSEHGQLLERNARLERERRKLNERDLRESVLQQIKADGDAAQKRDPHHSTAKLVALCTAVAAVAGSPGAVEFFRTREAPDVTITREDVKFLRDRVEVLNSKLDHLAGDARERAATTELRLVTLEREQDEARRLLTVRSRR